MEGLLLHPASQKRKQRASPKGHVSSGSNWQSSPPLPPQHHLALWGLETGGRDDPSAGLGGRGGHPGKGESEIGSHRKEVIWKQRPRHQQKGGGRKKWGVGGGGTTLTAKSLSGPWQESHRQKSTPSTSTCYKKWPDPKTCRG